MKAFVLSLLIPGAVLDAVLFAAWLGRGEWLLAGASFTLAVLSIATGYQLARMRFFFR